MIYFRRHNGQIRIEKHFFKILNLKFTKIVKLVFFRPKSFYFFRKLFQKFRFRLERLQKNCCSMLRQVTTSPRPLSLLVKSKKKNDEQMFWLQIYSLNDTKFVFCLKFHRNCVVIFNFAFIRFFLTSAT